MIQSEKLLGKKKQVTLTVTTNPAAATCKLTYDGHTYTAKTATVDVGTLISYSISYDNTTTKTGSFTMNRDRTLTATRTYSTSTSYVSWTRPNLTADGTLGSSNYAAACDTIYSSSYHAYMAFDNITSTSSTTGTNRTNGWLAKTGNTTGNIWFYNKDAIKVSKIVAYPLLSYGWQNLTVYGGNSKSGCTNQLGKYTGSSRVTYTSSTPYTTINISTNTAYKYLKFYADSGGGVTPGITEIKITATKETTSYTYYFDVSVT